MNNKNLVFNLIIIFISCIFSYRIYKNETQKVDLLVKQIEEERKKNEIIELILKEEKRYKSLKEIINKKDVSLLIDEFRKIAQKFFIDIRSIKPAEEIDEKDWKKYSFVLTLSVDSYHNLGKFINQLEKESAVYIVEKIEVTSLEGSQPALSCELIVSTLLLK